MNDSQRHKQDVSRGRLVDDLKFMKGWQEILLPKLQYELGLALKRVFDKRISDDNAKERIAYYNGLNKIFDILNVIEKNKKLGVAYFDKQGLNI